MKAPLSLILVTVFAATSRDSQAASSPPDPLSVAGCYTLKLGAWQPRVELGGDEAFITPPSHVELRATKGTEGWSKGHYTLLPAFGGTALHSGMFWHFTKGRDIQLEFTTGYCGLTMALHRVGENLSGSAESFWDDFRRPHQTAKVVATRVPCQQRPSK